MEKFSRWVLRSCDTALTEELVRDTGISRPVACVLANRGILHSKLKSHYKHLMR